MDASRMRTFQVGTLTAVSVVFVLAICGCGRDEGSRDSTGATKTAPSSSIPSRSVQGSDIRSVDRDALRTRIVGFNRNPNGFQQRYADVLKAANAAEQERLVALGFPTDADLKRLSALSVEDLQTRVKAGDKAALWYLTDSLSAGVRGLQATRSPEGYAGGITDADMISATTDILNLGGQTLREIQGPFGAYVYGQSLASATYPPSEEAIAAAYQIAGERGDWRANELYSAYVEAHPGLNLERVQTLQHSMRQVLSFR